MKRIPWDLFGAVANLAVSTFLLVLAVIAATHARWAEGTFWVAFLILLDMRDAYSERKRRQPPVFNVTINGDSLERVVDRKRAADRASSWDGGER